jgi:nucleoid DNA-binding protein
MFRKMGTEIKSGETILIKNFGSFKIKSRLPRRRYDQGMKKTVITAPKDIIQFTQSPNVFRYVIKKDEED